MFVLLLIFICLYFWLLFHQSFANLFTGLLLKHNTTTLCRNPLKWDNIESTHLGFSDFVLVKVFLDFNPAHQEMTWYLPPLLRLIASQPFWLCLRFPQRYLPHPIGHSRLRFTHFTAFSWRPVVHCFPHSRKTKTIFVSLFGIVCTYNKTP